MQTREDIISRIKEVLVTNNDLVYLKDIPPETLTNIYNELQSYIDRIDELQRPIYKVMAFSTQFIPNFIIAKMAHDFLTPYIIAQVCLYMDVKAAAKIAKSLHVDYMGQVTLHADTHVTSSIANHMEPDLIVGIVKHMAQMDFYHKLGELSDLLDERLMITVTQKLNDAITISRIVTQMTNEDKIIRLSRHWSTSLRDGILLELGKMGNPIKEKL